MLLYALLAAASPATLLATLVVLGTGRGRSNGTAFMVAYLFGTSLAFAVALLVGGSIAGSPAAGDDAATAIELIGGLALLALAFRSRRTPRQRGPGAPGLDERFVRLSQIRPAVAFGIGFPLGIGAKRLVITLLTAATVTIAALTPVEEAALGVVYVAVASLTVCVPVAVYLLLGRRADDAVTAARAWIANNEDRLTFASLLVLGALLIADGLIRLLA